MSDEMERRANPMQALVEKMVERFPPHWRAEERKKLLEFAEQVLEEAAKILCDRCKRGVSFREDHPDAHTESRNGSGWCDAMLLRAAIRALAGGQSR